MAVTIGDVTIRIGASTKTLNRDLRNAERSLQASAAKFQAIGSSLTLGVTAPLALIGGASFKMASDFEESLNKVRVAFGDSAADVEAFAKTTLTSIGLAEGSALEMASLFGDMATSMGLTQPAAAQMSKSLVSLAGDLASFKNINISEAQTALAGVFTGETESLKRLGVVMTETNLQAFALEQGINKKVNAMTQAEKVSLRYAYIMNNTKNAQGDFARTADGAANQMRTFQESVKQLGASFGSILLPIITPIIVKVNEIVAKFQGLDAGTKKLIVTIAAIAAAIGPAILIFGKLQLAVGLLQIAWINLSTAFAAGGIKAAFAFLGGPAILIVGAVAAAVYLIYKNWETVKKSMIDVANYFVHLYNNSIIFRGAINSVVAIFKNIAAGAQLAFKIILSGVELIGKTFVDTFKNIGALIEAVLTGDFDVIPGIIKKAFTGGFGNVKTLLNDTSKNFAEFNATTLSNAKEAIDNTFNAQPIKRFGIEGVKAAEKVKEACEEIEEIDLNITGDDKPLTDLQKELLKLNADLVNIQRQSEAGIITPQEASEQRLEILKKKLILLVNNGFKPTSKAVIDLKNEIDKLEVKELKLNVVSDLSDVNFEDVGLQIAKLENAVSFGLLTPFDLAAEKTKVLQDQLKALSDAGVDPSSSAVTNLKNQITSLNDEQNRVIATTQTYLQLIGLLPGQFNVFTAKLSESQQKVIEFTKSTSDAINAGLSQAIAGGLEAVGTLIGNLISGEGAGGLKTFFNSILTVILDFAIGLGKQLIALGTATESLKKLFTNPIGAIIAGVGLIAVATIVKGIISKGVPSLSIGTDKVKSDGLAMLHKGEAIVPANVVGGGFTGGGGTQIYGRLSGIDLLLSNQYATGYQKRLR